jgi:hypothetical protein
VCVALIVWHYNVRVRAEPDAERPPAVEQQRRSPASDVRAHTGFFVRSTLSGGYTLVTTTLPPSQGPGQFAFKGFGWGLAADIGAAVIPNLIVHLRLLFHVLRNPDASVDGQSTGSTSKTSVIETAGGVGATYYVMPAHVYMTVAIGLAGLILTLEQLNAQANTNAGFWGNADIGIETWLGSAWSGGIAARVMYAAMPGGDGSDVSAVNVGLVLSLSGNLF